MPGTDARPATRTRVWTVAAGLMALQAIALIVVGAVAAVDLNARAISFGLTLWALAACCAALAWFLWRHNAVARTPTLVWNVLLVPCGFTVADGGAPAAGWAMVALAVLTFVATVLLPAHRPQEGADA